MMQNLLQQLAGVIGICAYIILLFKIFNTKTDQSFAAFMLWAMLDTIATITTIFEDGNYWLPLSNAIGSTIIAVVLMLRKQISWLWIETMTASLVTICLIIWYFSNEQTAIIASSLAVLIASIPQMVDTYKKPDATPALVYIIFLVANLLSFFAGKAWTIEERFYSGCSILLCVMIVIFSLRPAIAHKKRD